MNQFILSIKTQDFQDVYLLGCLDGPHDEDGVLDAVEVDWCRGEGVVLLQPALSRIATGA